MNGSVFVLMEVAELKHKWLCTSHVTEESTDTDMVARTLQLHFLMDYSHSDKKPKHLARCHLNTRHKVQRYKSKPSNKESRTTDI